MAKSIKSLNEVKIPEKVKKVKAKANTLTKN